MSKKNKLTLTFEEAISELESIVETLERGNIPLEESLKVFERGMELAALCSSHLSTAEKKIELLLTDKDGKISLKPANILHDSGEE